MKAVELLGREWVCSKQHPIAWFLVGSKLSPNRLISLRQPIVLCDAEDYVNAVRSVACRLTWRTSFVASLTRTGDFQIKIRMGDDMPKKAGKVGEWKGFADISVSKADKPKIKQYASDGDKVLEDLENLIGSSYKVTLSFDSRSDAHMCSISCYDDNSENYKHTMVTRAKTAWGSLCAGLYKHWVIADGKWGTADDLDIDF